MLVLVINYTGDRIHFGLAVERARKEGIKVGRVSSFMELLFIKTAFFIYLLAYVFVSYVICVLLLLFVSTWCFYCIEHFW